jgi:hypothetical protein
MTKGPCAMRGLLHGPLVSIRSAWPAGNPREVLRDGPTEVLLDDRRAPEYALTAAGSTHAEGGPNPTGRLRRRVPPLSLVDRIDPRG